MEAFKASTAVYLKNGEQVKINDHVYCSPTWSIRDGTPYSIARVMEYLPPAGLPKSEAEQHPFTRVRLAWYYRPSDVSDRPVADSRLLLAAIYSEVCDINQIRAKCHVVHRDKISDLAGWKKRPDRFYFTRLFDPYIKKEFEIIQSSDVRNLPDDVRQNLIDKYEYVVSEKEVLPDLTDNLRLCKPCQKWAPSAESVQCDRCKEYFHMGCVQPPLLAKPSRGYGWSCAPCSRVHEEEVDSHDVRHTTPSGKPKSKSSAPTTRGRGRPRKDKSQADKEEGLPVKHFRMWPFRYFGQYTVAEDTLDDDDLIFPNAPVRQGPKYQAVLPELNAPPIDEERGGDSTIEVYSAINILTDAEVAEMEAHKATLSDDPKVQSSVDWLTEVIHRYSDAALAARSLSTVTMKKTSRIEQWKPRPENPWIDKEWTKEEIAVFEDAIQSHGAELRPVREEVGTRTIAEVVRFYGHWKNAKVGEENVLIRQQRVSGNSTTTPSSSTITTTSRPPKQTVGSPPGEGSLVENPPSRTPTCGACRTKESKVWWKAPKGLQSSLLCDICGQNWRKYADLNVRPLREESVPIAKGKEREKREGTPLNGPVAKRARTSISAQSTPPPAPPTTSSAQVLKCQACKKNGVLGKVLECKKCTFRVHAGSCGALVDPANIENWLCDICQNDVTQETSMIPECVLCPRQMRPSGVKYLGPPNDSYLRACKPTEGQGWAHVLCSVFIPEVAFTDAGRMKLVEGISVVNHHRWVAKCYICRGMDGAVVKCNDCPREYHVSCAWNSGFKFGFEIQPVKSSRRDTTITTTFKSESGCMNPIISCKEHDHTRRYIYGICEMNEGGETAIQVYCRAYKQADVAQSHALFRKARRLDHILNIKGETQQVESAAPQSQDQECSVCHTQFAPAFYPESGGGWLCHSCHFTREEEPAVNGNAMMVDSPLTAVSVN